MRRKISLILTLLIISSFIFSCATFQQDYEKLTPEQKVRFKLYVAQDQLENLFDSGKRYVEMNPQYKDEWKEKIIPAFDTANKALKAGIYLSMDGSLTPDNVDEYINPLIDSVINLLTSIGWVKEVQ